jgi:hypothetical protein
MREERITLTKKEHERLAVVRQVMRRELKQNVAAELLSFSNEKMRQIMIGAGLWRVHRHKSEVHPWREPRAHYGEMVQMDGSHHAWLETRGPLLVLMGMVDDARNRFYGRFYAYEGVYPAMNVLEGYLRRFGLPQSLSVDKQSTYKTVRHPSEDELLKGEKASTQFERAAQELGSSSFRPTRHRPRAGSSGPSPHSRTGWSRNCAWLRSRPWRKPTAS